MYRNVLQTARVHWRVPVLLQKWTAILPHLSRSKIWNKQHFWFIHVVLSLQLKVRRRFGAIFWCTCSCMYYWHISMNLAYVGIWHNSNCIHVCVNISECKCRTGNGWHAVETFFSMVSTPVKFELLDSLKCHITHSSVTNLCLDLFSTFTSTLSQFCFITPYQSLFPFWDCGHNN